MQEHPVQQPVRLVNMDVSKMMIQARTLQVIALIVLLVNPTITPELASAKYAHRGNTKKIKDKCRAKSAKLAPTCLIQEVSTFSIVQYIHVKPALVLRVSMHVLLHLLDPYMYNQYLCTHSSSRMSDF